MTQMGPLKSALVSGWQRKLISGGRIFSDENIDTNKKPVAAGTTNRFLIIGGGGGGSIFGENWLLS